ncbi:hypothetical protein [Paraburkholderia diazotrophica]|uniref:Uncharacterized protein n=1 Tax=Paraburkholderia diazotrophica TaxID=667676 RepID=A0A1H7DW37_9BURK|nr:hypothetical protein [Paraburkholderia diazotrophica]SEK05943.1 hypothetical protein SAMN05192539_103610 [Paraburkholderia diazotrophica]
MTGRYLVGRWESPWASDPFLKIRIAVEVDTQSVVTLHHFVDGAWRRFRPDEDAYVRDLVNDEIDAIIECPEEYGLDETDAIPTAWSNDEANPVPELPEDDEDTSTDQFEQEGCSCCERWYREGSVSECECA